MICRWMLLGAVVMGCADVTNAPAADPSKSLDEAVFDCNVQPILVRQCSYQACHGQPGTALRVYSPGKLRGFVPQNLDDLQSALGSDEIHANFLSATGFAATASDPAQNYLLLKPLPSSAGGYEHAGGAIYTGTSDPQYVAIHAWLAGTGACTN